MKTKILVIASQDFEAANHKGLWEKLAEKSGEDVIVVNIPADRIVSPLTRHRDRIADARKGPKHLREHLTVVRPLLDVRPEIVPDILFPFIAGKFWNCLNQAIPDLDQCALRILVYNAYWVKILKGTRKNISFAYYLFDEVRYNGNDNSVDQKRYAYDEFACKNSDVVFAMSDVLAKSREEYNHNMIILGNGALLPAVSEHSNRKIDRSFAFTGNFRDWIDKDLLTDLIRMRPDILFVFAGTVEENMKEYFNDLLNHNMNTVWFGKVQKDDMPALYSMFDGIIVPYKKNDFMKATRPIKIVEAVLSGTPVITVPMNGYKESSFIRFSESAEGFSRQIDFLLTHPLDQNTDEYKDFVAENTWDRKAEKIISAFETTGK